MGLGRILGQHVAGRAHLLMLFGIVLVATALRLWRLDYGLPQFLYPDEAKYIRLANAYLKDHHVPNPHYFLNPPLFSHLVLGSVALLDALNVPVGKRHQLIIVSRALSASLGTLSVFLIFLIGTHLRGRRAGLVSASLFAVNFLAVRSSHQGVNDMLMLVLLLLCVYSLVRGSGDIGAPKLHRGVVVAACVGGLGVSAKYNGAIGLLPVGALMLLRWGGWVRSGQVAERWRTILKEAGVLAGWFILGLVAGNPWILDTPKEVWAGFLSQIDVGSECWPGQELIPMGVQVAKALVQASGIATLLFAVLGLILVVRERHLPLQLIALMTLVYLAYFALVSKALFARFLIPSLPGICLLAAVSIERPISWDRSRLKAVLFAVFVGLSLSQPLLNSLRFARILSRPDTRTTAAVWAAGHIPPTSDRYYLFRKDVLSLERFGFTGARPARISSDGTFERGYYLVTSFDIREGCVNFIDSRLRAATDLLFQQGVVIYHDNPALAYNGPPIHENVYSPYYELGAIDRGGPEIWIIKVDH